MKLQFSDDIIGLLTLRFPAVVDNYLVNMLTLYRYV